MSDSETARGNQIQSLTRAFAVVEVLSHHDQGATLAEITAATGMNRTTVWRLVASLRELGVVRDGRDGRLTLGPRLVYLGAVARRQLLVSPEVPAILLRLRDNTSETCHLAAPEGMHMVYLEKVESTQTVRAASRVGGYLDLHCTALGKAFLAFAEDAVRESLLGRMTLTARTPQSFTDPAALRADLERTRARGWALDDEENERDMRCVAAPVLDNHGHAVAAVSVSVPIGRLPVAELPALAAQVATAAAELSRALISVGPSQ